MNGVDKRLDNEQNIHIQLIYMSCLTKLKTKKRIKKLIPIFTLVGILFLAVSISNKIAEAAKLSDGTWSQSASPGTTTVTYSNTTALDSSSDIILTFPSTATVDQDGTGIAVTGQTNPVRSNNTVDNTITITIDGTMAAGLGVTITMDDALTAYTTTTYVQESLAINTQDSGDSAIDFGVALITNGTSNETTVTASVPLFVNMAIDDITVELGTLSTASVATATQTYTVNSNNQSGVTMQIVADGDMDDGATNTIADVGDGTVDAGSEEYGISVSAANGLSAVAPYDSGDDPVPQVADDIADSSGSVSGGTLDVTYKASIAGTTVAGEYNQVVTMTIATNS
jgi:hypothetical protein